jgi:hypothetical protein
MWVILGHEIDYFGLRCLLVLIRMWAILGQVVGCLGLECGSYKIRRGVFLGSGSLLVAARAPKKGRVGEMR